MEQFSKIIQWHRKKSKLSQIQLAELAGVGKTVVFDIEHGKETIRFSSLQKVCGVLNISIQMASPLMERCVKEITR